MDCESTGHRVHRTDRNHYFSSSSTVRRCLSALRWWVAMVFHNIPSFRMRMQASLDSASIAVRSHSVKFIFKETTATSSERIF